MDLIESANMDQITFEAARSVHLSIVSEFTEVIDDVNFIGKHLISQSWLGTQKECGVHYLIRPFHAANTAQ